MSDEREGEGRRGKEREGCKPATYLRLCKVFILFK